MAAGALSSEAMTLRSLDLIEAHQHLNAFITVAGEAALARARRLDSARAAGSLPGPLHGIPLAVKDNIHVAGMPSTAGTPALKDFVPDEDAPAISRLKAAGAIVIGKTNLHELAFGVTSINPAFGAVGNAIDNAFIAGGSSGGTATAVAAGMVIAGFGTDTGGSSRIPAALNGIAGFRPTPGRYPAEGITPISSTRDVIGPMARAVADIALLDGVLADIAEPLPQVALSDLRLGVPHAWFHDNLEAGIADAVESLHARLRAAGVALVDVELPEVGALTGQIGFPVALYETGKLLPTYLQRYRPGLGFAAFIESIASPDVKAILTNNMKTPVSEKVYRQAMQVHRPRLQRVYQACFAEHQVQALLFPTTPITARRTREVSDTIDWNGEPTPVFNTYIRNTDPGSNAGLPGLSLPLARPVGQLPAGIAIDGPPMSDRRLLAIGIAIEALMNHPVTATTATQPQEKRP